MSKAAVKALLGGGVRRLGAELGWAGRFFSDADSEDDDVPECAARDGDVPTAQARRVIASGGRGRRP